MDLTEDRKTYIDTRTYEDLLRRVRFGKVGDEWFQGATGKYWWERMEQLKSRPGGQEEHVRASKAIGWNKSS